MALTWISDPYLWLPVDLVEHLATVGENFNNWQHRLVHNEIVDAFILTGSYDLPAGRRHRHGKPYGSRNRDGWRLHAEQWGDSLGLEPDVDGPMCWRFKDVDDYPEGFHTYQFQLAAVVDDFPIIGGERRVDATHLDDALRIASQIPNVANGHWHILNLRRVR